MTSPSHATDGRPAQSAGAQRLLRRRLAFAGAVAAVCVAVVLAHRKALTAEALCADDVHQVLENPLVQNPSWESVARLFSEVFHPSTGGYYKPLAMVSLMLDRLVVGRPADLRVFRPASLALHVVNTVLVICLMYLLFAARWPALFTGLLFGLHPVMVEAIPWAAERKSLLAAFFSLAALVLYVRFAQRRGWTAYAFALACFLLALLSKPTSVPLPALLLVLDFWPLRRLSRRALLEKIPFFALAGVSAAITFVSQSLAGVTALEGSGTLLPDTPWRIPLTICYNVVFYLFKFIWPIPLSAYYAFPEPFDLTNRRLLIGVIGSLLLLGGLAWSLRRTRALAAGWTFFFVAILPAIGIIGFTNTIAADRFLYLPSVGFFMVLAWLLTRAWNANAEAPPRQRLVRTGCVLVIAGLAAAGAYGSDRYLRVWQNSVDFYSHQARLAPTAAPVWNSLAASTVRDAARSRAAGDTVGARRKLQDAVGMYRRALRLAPGYSHARLNLGLALLGLGDLTAAEEQLQAAVRAMEDDPRALTGLGKARFARMEELLRAGGGGTPDPEAGQLLKAARSRFEQAVALDPSYGEAHLMLGITLAKSGELAGAIGHFEKARDLDARNLEARLNLVRAYSLAGRRDAAEIELRQVLRVDPDNPVALGLLQQWNVGPQR